MKALEINHTRIRIHPLALLTALAFIGMGQGLSVLMALLALSLHELAHVLAAKGFQNPSAGVEITPFGGVEPHGGHEPGNALSAIYGAAAGAGHELLCMPCVRRVCCSWAGWRIAVGGLPSLEPAAALL